MRKAYVLPSSKKELMRIQSFIIAYALVLAILLFADRRPGSNSPDRYSHVVDLTEGQSATPHSVVTGSAASASVVSTSVVRKSVASESLGAESKTRIIAPAALIPGTWAAGQIPAERLIAPLVVIDLKDLKDLKAGATPEGENRQRLTLISLDDIAAWESLHGMIPQGAVVAIRRASAGAALPRSDLSTNFSASASSSPLLPITRDAAMFLIEARNTIGFAVETPVALSSDRNLAQQLALHGNYVVHDAAHFNSLPVTGSLVIVAPAKNKKAGEAPVRVLAMVR
jgi:kynurenine formamidase